jgi:predicted esterase
MIELAQRLDMDDVHYVMPVADDNSWYPDRFIAPYEANEPLLGHALDAYARIVDGLAAAGWPPERLALVGFSQGACLTLDYVARNPRRYGAVAALTGGLIGPEGAPTRPAASLDGTPMLVTTKEQDEWVPPFRTRESAELLRAAGADVDLRIPPGDEHSMTDDEVDAVRELIRAAAGGR